MPTSPASQQIAPAEQQTVPAPQKPAKERRIPKRIAQAIELLVTGECTTQKAAAERVGLTPTWFCKALQKDNARVFYARRVRQTIAGGAAPAAARLIELIRSDSDHVSADVSKYLLAVEGIAPANTPQVNVNIELKAGYVIDLSEQPRHDRDISKIIEHSQSATADSKSAGADD